MYVVSPRDDDARGWPRRRDGRARHREPRAEIARIALSWVVRDALPRFLAAAGESGAADALRALEPDIVVALPAARRRLHGFVGRLESHPRRPFPSCASTVETFAGYPADLTPAERRAALHVANVLRLAAEVAAARRRSAAEAAEVATRTALQLLTRSLLSPAGT